MTVLFVPHSLDSGIARRPHVARDFDGEIEGRIRRGGDYDLGLGFGEWILRRAFLPWSFAIGSEKGSRAASSAPEADLLLSLSMYIERIYIYIN